MLEAQSIQNLGFCARVGVLVQASSVAHLNAVNFLSSEGIKPVKWTKQSYVGNSGFYLDQILKKKSTL